jgi:PAS domain S-box-containing protein
VRGEPAVILRVLIPREIHSQGHLSLRYLLLSLLAAGVLFSLMTLLLLEKLVLSPLTQLNAGVGAISQSGDLAARVPVHGAMNSACWPATSTSCCRRWRFRACASAKASSLSRDGADGAQRQRCAVRLLSAARAVSVVWQHRPDSGLRNQRIRLDLRRLEFEPASDDRTRVLEAYHHSCRSGEVFNEEYRIRHKDGSYLYWMNRGKPFYENGELVRFTGSCTDISERKRSEEALRVSEERLARILETNADGIIICDENGYITFANAAAEDIFGLSRQEIVRRSYTDATWGIRGADDAPLAHDNLPFARVKRTEQPVLHVEHAVTHPLGHRVIISINAAPLRDAADTWWAWSRRHRCHRTQGA